MISKKMKALLAAAAALIVSVAAVVLQVSPTDHGTVAKSAAQAVQTVGPSVEKVIDAIPVTDDAPQDAGTAAARVGQGGAVGSLRR